MTYVLFFIGMFFLGETVLLPAIYLSLEGKMSIWAVIGLSAGANLLSDFAWYYAARLVPFERVIKWQRVEKHQGTFTKLAVLIARHEYLILFISKFVYGTRILVQVICGVRRMDLLRYTIINLAGIIAYLAFLYGVAFGVDWFTVGPIVGIIVFVVLVVIINLCIRAIAQRKWFQSSSQHITKSEPSLESSVPLVETNELPK